MDVRAQIAMVFHLDKCIGCHTCSIACKNIWSDRNGTEYMWWNNVETKPGTGYPTLWENQDIYHGGWQLKDGDIKLRLHGRAAGLANIFHNPSLPTMDDYYEPWTYQYDHLFTAPEGDDQPTARPVSMVTGKPIEIEAGPNWDDDLAGSRLYAANDPNLAELSAEERRQLNELERAVFFYVPRICNHCLNPGCVAACPAGAIYKRGEDGIVLVSQEKCRGWRMCISGCPYKKVYYNWSTGKSEKCILCFPRLETGQAPACFHSCVGRIRYLGVLLYDADRIKEAVSVPDEQLVEAQRSIILDPDNPEVIAAARASGVRDDVIAAAGKSPAFKFVKQWKLALPLHPEFRTLPTLFYVPPLGPVRAAITREHYEIPDAEGKELGPMLSSLEKARIPIRFMANMFTAGNEDVLRSVYRKLIAVRFYMRSKQVKDVSENEVTSTLRLTDTTPEEAEAIYRLTAVPTFEERFVMPPLSRETALEPLANPYDHKLEAGFGFREPPLRKW